MSHKRKIGTVALSPSDGSMSVESGEESYSGEDEVGEGESEDGTSSGSDRSDSTHDVKSRSAANSTAYGRAFAKIMKQKIPASARVEEMGPVLSMHKQLISKELDEAANEQKANSAAKREKQAIRERAHCMPVSHVDAKEKALIKLATKGVVKLFNAVSKAQRIQVDAKTSKASDANALMKQSKAVFLAELRGSVGTVLQNGATLNGNKEGTTENRPSWSILQDNFMLGKSRLKDWDKREDMEVDNKGNDDGSASE
eukprot:c25074_g1_i1 orf=254-1021(+)